MKSFIVTAVDGTGRTLGKLHVARKTTAGAKLACKRAGLNISSIVAMHPNDDPTEYEDLDKPRTPRSLDDDEEAAALEREGQLQSSDEQSEDDDDAPPLGGG